MLQSRRAGSGEQKGGREVSPVAGITGVPAAPHTLPAVLRKPGRNRCRRYRPGFVQWAVVRAVSGLSEEALVAAKGRVRCDRHKGDESGAPRKRPGPVALAVAAASRCCTC